MTISRRSAVFATLAATALASAVPSLPVPARAATTTAEDDADWRQYCVTRVTGSNQQPVPDCLKAFGIAGLAPPAQQAWLQRLRLDSDRWQAKCEQAYPAWAKAAGYTPPSATGKDRLMPGTAYLDCRQAFIDTALTSGATDVARGAAVRETIGYFVTAQRSRNEATEHEAATDQPPPKIVSMPDLASLYPALALRERRIGRAIADCTLDPGGRPRDCTISETSGQPDLDTATIHFAERMQFTQTLVGGKPVSRKVRIPVRWTLP